MYELNPDYLEKLELVAGEIQESDELAKYLEEEEEEFYNQLKEQFEPRLALVHDEVAAHHPLQLINLELVMLDPAFEGLFLPRLLGYSVLRGEVDDEAVKYTRPQDHFKEVLLTICNSANFDILKKRIGQSIQVGFALSSDIWVTNLINSIENKRIRHYLQGQKLDRYHMPDERRRGYQRYARQFKNENFLTVSFPETAGELTITYNSLRDFLLYRIAEQEDNSSLIAPLDQLVANEELHGTKEHLLLCVLYGAFFDAPQESREALAKHFNKVRKEVSEADELVLAFLLQLHHMEGQVLTPEADQRLSAIVDKKIDDQLSSYFTLLDTIHGEGYTNETAQEAIKVAYLKHDGLSSFNEGIRRSIYQYLERFVKNLEVKDYPEFFEITKLFGLYMGLFLNQQFNQDLKDLSMGYLRKLLKHYTDKRGKDYQDIKKFVSATFLDFNFLTEKEIVNLFKTRRKRKKVEE